MMIRVEYSNGQQHLVHPHQLNRLLSYDLIEKFERSDGWVKVCDGKLRNPLGNPGYEGPERRAVPYA